jgi:hypothetical protein
LFARSFSEDNDVVEIGVAEEPKVGVKHWVDEALEDWRGSGKTHWHDCVFVKAVEGFEGGVFLMAGRDAKVREAGADVKGGDPVRACKITHDGAGEWDRVLVRFDLGVKVTVIDHKAKLSWACSRRRISDKEDRGRGCGFGGTDETPLKFEVEELLELFEFFSGHVIEFALLEDLSFTDLDLAVMLGSVSRKFVGGLVREHGVGVVAEFQGNGFKPTFFVAG